MPAYMTTYAPKPDTLKIPISTAYLLGRAARNGRLDYYKDNPYGYDRYTERLDWFIGYEDEEAGVSVEFRREAEENGERF